MNKCGVLSGDQQTVNSFLKFLSRADYRQDQALFFPSDRGRSAAADYGFDRGNPLAVRFRRVQAFLCTRGLPRNRRNARLPSP